MTTPKQREWLMANGWFLASEIHGEWEKWRKDIRGVFPGDVFIELDDDKPAWCCGPVEEILPTLHILGLVTPPA